MGGGFGGPVRFGGPVGGGFGGGRGCGCAGGFFAALLVLALLIGGFSSCERTTYGGMSYGSQTQSASASSSTIREKLTSADVTKTDWYTDEDGTWIHNASKLTSGLEHFYDKTGVQPYVYILKNGTTTSVSELNTKAEELYDQLFSDEGHFLLVFCDDGQESFNYGACLGTKASAIMDSEAQTIFDTELSQAYNSADSEEEVFSQAFSNTADQIMSAAESKQTEDNIGKFLIAAVVCAGVVAVVVIVIRKRQEKAEKTAKRAEEILNTPLEKFGEDATSKKNIEDLASKYEDKSNGSGGSSS